MRQQPPNGFHQPLRWTFSTHCLLTNFFPPIFDDKHLLFLEKLHTQRQWERLVKYTHDGATTLISNMVKEVRRFRWFFPSSITLLSHAVDTKEQGSSKILLTFCSIVSEENSLKAWTDSHHFPTYQPYNSLYKWRKHILCRSKGWESDCLKFNTYILSTRGNGKLCLSR